MMLDDEVVCGASILRMDDGREGGSGANDNVGHRFFAISCDARNDKRGGPTLHFHCFHMFRWDGTGRSVKSGLLSN